MLCSLINDRNKQQDYKFATNWMEKHKNYRVKSARPTDPSAIETFYYIAVIFYFRCRKKLLKKFSRLKAWRVIIFALKMNAFYKLMSLLCWTIMKHYTQSTCDALETIFSSFLKQLATNKDRYWNRARGCFFSDKNLLLISYQIVDLKCEEFKNK